MKKKLTATCLALAFSAGTMPFAHASLKDEIKNYYINAGIEESVVNGLFSQEIEVPSDVMIKKSADTDYVNGPIEVNMKVGDTRTFDFKADIDMSNVKDAIAAYLLAAQLAVDSTGDDDIQAELDSAVIDETKSGFKITINYPANCTIPAAFLEETEMSDIFSTEDGKDLTAIYNLVSVENDADAHELVITIGINENVGLTVLDANLADLTLTCTGVKLKAKAEGNAQVFTVKSKIEGKTVIKSSVEELGDVTYIFVQKENDTTNGVDYVDPENSDADYSISASVKADIEATLAPAPSTGGGGSLNYTQKTLTVVLDGMTPAIFKYEVGKEVVIADLDIPTHENGLLPEFYLDIEHTQLAPETIKMDDNVSIYVKWVEAPVEPTPSTTESVLDSENHFAYIIGYPTSDGTMVVKPEGNITREEVATIFYRLLKDDIRDELFTTENNFTDIDVERWSNKAVSTMAKGEYILGYPDGTFNPAANMTRAEFVTMAARLFGYGENTPQPRIADFPDTAEHWAAEYIRYASSMNWVRGDENGNFLPDKSITRAEVMTIVNNMLDRHVNAEGLVEGITEWADNASDAWYYYEVIEATNPHNYEKAEDAEFETWTELTEHKVIIEKPVYEDADVE